VTFAKWTVALIDGMYRHGYMLQAKGWRDALRAQTKVESNRAMTQEYLISGHINDQNITGEGL
jgi:hypothetical protein